MDDILHNSEFFIQNCAQVILCSYSIFIPWSTKLNLRQVKLQVTKIIIMTRIKCFLSPTPYNTHLMIVQKCFLFFIFLMGIITKTSFSYILFPSVLLLAIYSFRIYSFFLWQSNQFSCSVMSDSLRSHGLQHTRPSCPSPTPLMSCHFLLQGIFLTSGFVPRSPALQTDSLPSEP